MPRIAGYEIQLYDTDAVAAHGFRLRDGGNREVEGKLTRVSYIVSDGATPVAGEEVVRRCATVLAKRGGTKVLDEVTESGVDLTFTVPLSGTTVWVDVQSAADGSTYTVTVVEEGQMEGPEEAQTPAEFSPLALVRALEEKGVVVVSSITFDGDTARLNPDSEMMMLSIVQALQVEPSLKLEIRGHVDVASTAVANMKLSKERANAIRAYLVEKGGIDGSRLTAIGLGDRRPVTDRESAGPNTRVELVQKD